MAATSAEQAGEQAMTTRYEITMLTFDGAIPTGSQTPGKFAPWANRGEGRIVELSPGRRETILLEDDDDKFHNGYYTPEETHQILIEDRVFGADTDVTPAGTRLAGFIGSRLVDDDGNHFRVMFPRTFVSGGLGQELGSRQAVLVLPEPVRDGDGNPVLDAQGNQLFPVFDQARTFRFVETVSVGTGDPHAPKYAFIPCFAGGTLIETATGPRAIETLAPGAMIRTRDNGLRRIAWIGHTSLDRRQLDLRPNLRPILIRAGALAPGLPERDLTVSPQHRVLVSSKIVRRMFGQSEILVAAKHLLAHPGIEAICPDEGVTYWHMLFDRHELVLSNGTWTESLFTGPYAMRNISYAARREIFSLFPELARPEFCAHPARLLLNGQDGRKLAERHIRNRQPLVSSD